MILLFFFKIQHSVASECFSNNEASSYNIPERYRSIPAQLLEVLRRSYLQHTSSNNFLDNGFWGTNREDKCDWPQTLWKALDNISLVGLYTIASVYKRMSDAGLWAMVSRMRNVWHGTSYGFGFTSNLNDTDIESMIRGNSSFCRDLETVSGSYHDGQICWREVSSTKSGLHICFGAGSPPSVHIDFNQPALGRIPFSDTCVYDPIAVAKHYKDLKSKPPLTIFDALAEEKQNMQELLSQTRTQCPGYNSYLQQASIEGILKNFDNDILIPMALKGEARAKTEGLRLLRRVNQQKENLFAFSLCRCP